MSLYNESIKEKIKNCKKLEEDFDQLKSRYDLIIKSSNDGYWEWNISDETLITSAQWKITFGLDAHEHSSTFPEWSNRLHPDDKERVLGDIQRHLSGEDEFYHSEYRVLHENGEYLYMMDKGQAAFDDNKNAYLMIGSCINVTDKVNEATKYAESENSLTTILNCMSEGILVIDTSGKFIYANDNLSKLVGFTAKEMMGKTALYSKWRIIHEDGSNYPSEIHPGMITLQTGKAVKNDIQGIYNDETLTWVIVNSEPMFKSDSTELLGAVITFTDITEKRKNEEYIQKLAFTDVLTDLPNRQALDLHLNELIIQTSSNNVSSAIFMIDLDRFKWVNDSLGHSFGDKLLIEVKDRFLKIKRATDYVARIGGDEFIIVVENVDVDTAKIIAQGYLECLIESFFISSHQINITPSIGVCMLPEHGNDHETLFKNVDTAMYRAKEKGRNRVQVYHPELSEKIREKHLIGNALTNAMNDDQLSIHYQPQIDCMSGKIVGGEALLRWDHPELGSVSPVRFVPVAEDSGMIICIGKWLIEEVCKNINSWMQQGMSVVPIAINLSARQFSDEFLISDMKSLLLKYNIPVELIHFELTESVLINNDSNTINNIRSLFELGFRLAIDDFGTGYSSLSYLKDLPMGCVKIDRSFVKNLDDSQADQVIAKTIIDLANNMSMSVVAEGVETKRQMEIIKGLGCNIIQGYYYSKPLPTEKFVDFFNFNLAQKDLILDPA